MKTSSIFGVATLVAGIIILCAQVTVAQTPEQISAAKDLLAKVPAADLGGKAAQLVANAPAKEKAAVAAAVAHTVAVINPDVASAAVSAIALRTPVVAPAAAAAAASKLPGSASAIAVAAASVPGVLAGEVRTAVIAAVPRQAAQIVSALSRAKLTSSRGPITADPFAAKSGALAGVANPGVL